MDETEPVIIRPGREGSAARSYAGAILGNQWDSEVERVGSGRRIRGELVLILVGAVFVVGALLKPWVLIPAHVGPSSSPGSSGIAAAQASGSGQLGAAGATATDAQGPYGRFPVAWQLVDWSNLAKPDPDTGWGVAVATLPTFSRWSSGALNATPNVVWLASGSTPLTATVALPASQLAYAIGITWPKDVAATSVTFVYDGLGTPPAGIGGSGAYPPLTKLTPLPATQVTTQRPSAVGTAAIQSGRFWVAPVDILVVAGVMGNRKPAELWRISPWAWAAGEYTVTIKSKGSAMTMRLRLEQRA
jgi:hypothetical protein